MARTDWTSIGTVRPEDMNKIGQEINDLEVSTTVWLGVTEGTDTEYTATSNKVSSLHEGLRVSFRAHQTSGTNPTLQINSLGAILLKKPNGRAAKLDADGVYTAVYSAASFILQGEGGEYGTATAADVLAPKTIGTDNGIVTGTMQDLRGQVLEAGYFNPDRGTKIHVNQGQNGMVDGYTQYEHDIPTLISKNIKSGASILTVQGDPNVMDTTIGSGFTAATAADITQGTNAYANGQYIVGQRRLSNSETLSVNLLNQSIQPNSNRQSILKYIGGRTRTFAFQTAIVNSQADSYIEAAGVNTSVQILICDGQLKGAALKEAAFDATKKQSIWGFRVDLANGLIYQSDNYSSPIILNPNYVDFSDLRIMVYMSNFNLSMAGIVNVWFRGFYTEGN